MHTLIITDSYPNAYVPNQGVFVREQARALARSGVQVGVIACVPCSIRDVVRKGLSNLKAETLELENVQETIRCFIQIPKKYFYPIDRIARLGMPLIAQYIAKHGVPDILHVHGFHAGKLALLIREKYGTPTVVTEHNSRFISGTLDNARKEFAIDFFRKADMRIAVSNSFRVCLQQLAGVAFEVIPNVVDVTKFRPGVRNEKFIFLSAGRFDENKNQVLQIRSFSKIARQLDYAELWLAGDGARRASCELMVKELALTNRIRFLGMLSREELLNAMQAASVFLVSSKHETFGVVAIEAMSCGLAVVSTPCGGTEDTVRGLGRITDGSEEDFAHSMLQTYAERASHQPQTLHDAMDERYSYEAVASLLLQVYSQLLQSRS